MPHLFGGALRLVTCCQFRIERLSKFYRCGRSYRPILCACKVNTVFLTWHVGVETKQYQMCLRVEL